MPEPQDQFAASIASEAVEVLEDHLLFPGGYEVDFYLPEQRQLIQVAQNLDQAGTQEREIRALKDAIGSVKVQSALILADANGDSFKIDGVPVEIRSAAEWLLSE